MASIIFELTVDATMESFSASFRGWGDRLALHVREKGHDLPSGLPDALYCASILPAKIAPSWSPVNVTQVPSALLQNPEVFRQLNRIIS
jgi:hypothetical protein